MLSAIFGSLFHVKDMFVYSAILSFYDYINAFYFTTMLFNGTSSRILLNPFNRADIFAQIMFVHRC